MNWTIDTSGRTHRITIGDEVLTFAQVHSQYSKVESGVVRRRLAEGWEVEWAFTEPANNWAQLKIKQRILMVTEMLDKGMGPQAIADKVGDGMTANKIANFCSKYKIGRNEHRLTDPDTGVKPADSAGFRMGSAKLDPDTEPNEAGVPFGKTNNSTCRWPMWDDPVGPASERMCCGKHTVNETMYCSEHRARMRSGAA